MKINLKFLSIILFILVIVAFYLLNAAIPFYNDDLCYGFFVSHIEFFKWEKQISSVWDIFHSQWNHYFLCNGRSIIHFLVQLFCFGSGYKYIYDVFAALLFSIFTVTLGKLIFTSNGYNDQFLVTSLGCVGLFLYCLEEPTCLYAGISYGMNYLYSAAIWLAFIYLLCHKRTKEKWREILLFSLAIFAGWSHEGFSIPFCAGTLVWALINKRSLSRSEKIALILCYISSMIMIFAPGNFIRLNWVETESNNILIFFSPIKPHAFLILLSPFLLYIKYPQKITSFIKGNLPIIVAIIIAQLYLSIIHYNGHRGFFSLYLLEFILFFRLLIVVEWKRGIRILAGIGLLMVVLGLPAIIHYQKIAGREYRNLYALCEDERNDTVLFQFTDAEIPHIIQKFVCQHSYTWRFWDKQYSIRYKKPVYITDAPVVNCEQNKVPGDNPFYKVNDYWISKEQLPDSINIRIEQGEYQLWDWQTFVRRCYNFIKPIPATPMSFCVKPERDSICIGIDKYAYYVHQPYSRREILSVDVLE